jgi:transposase-like protein
MERGIDIASLCRQEGVSPTQYYSWNKHLVSSSDAVLGSKRGSGIDAKDVRLSAELTNMKNVVAEVTAENLELKKTLSSWKTTDNCRAIFSDE